MRKTESEMTADAEAEAYWSMRSKRNQTRREYIKRKGDGPLCFMCKTRPIEAKPGAIYCTTDAREYRRVIGEDPY